ncbi:MAG: hypothetical protein M3M99_02075, partial [Actinomycetota bacterium]|nr:hypothetical protein [Actinomycetota bacterium]
DEEDPCIDGGGVLSGWHKSNPVKKDVFIFDRIAGTFVNLPNLNTAGADETFCVLDAAGDYVGFARENVDGLQLYQLSSASLVPLPASVEAPGPHRNAIFSAPPCARRFATQIGSAGRDVIKGTPGEDVILGLEGNDKISGLNGKDVICGGKGKDKLIGGRGRDRLLGEQGSDVLKGGKGRDVLKGGKGRDDVTQ